MNLTIVDCLDARNMQKWNYVTAIGIWRSDENLRFHHDHQFGIAHLVCSTAACTDSKWLERLSLEQLSYVVNGHVYIIAPPGSLTTCILPFCHPPYFAIFLAFSTASSTLPTYMNACSGRASCLPSQISSKLRIVSSSCV